MPALSRLPEAAPDLDPTGFVRLPGAGRVVFGFGAESVTARLLVDAGARRVLLVAQRHHADGATRIAAALGERAAGVFLTDQAQVPGDVADAAVARARELDVDWVVAHGGGTPIGVAKAVALSLPVRVAAVPTTYAGSERTDVWGITRDGRKTTGRDPRVRPEVVVYDPELTLSLARELSLRSLFNALAHAVEASYAADVAPEALAAARRSLSPIVEGARRIGADPTDRAGRALALEGAAHASAALGGAAMGIHHKLAHVLGGSFGTAHAATHAVLLPYTLGFNAAFAPDMLQATRAAWNTQDPPGFLYDLQRALGLATSLRSLGLDEAQLPAIVDEVSRAAYANPRPITREALHELLSDALHDRRPSVFSSRLTLPPAAVGPHAALAATVHGAPLDRARAVVLALHGRGASGDRFAADLARRLGPREELAIVAPQARDNTWYPKPYRAPVEENQPQLDSALSVVEALYRELAARFGDERVVVAGFSQGACLALTWLSTTAARPRRVLAFTGAPTPLPTAGFGAAAGVELHLGASASDPWVSLAEIEAAVGRFRAAGARVNATVVPGGEHGLHPPDDAALRRAVDQALAGDSLAYQAGFGSTFAAEALPGALPPHQNSPRTAPYGLVAEQLNGTPFGVRRDENLRTWMYRLRPQILDRGYRPRDGGRFVRPPQGGVSLPEVLAFRPLELPREETDFLTGLTTFASAGDPALQVGAAIHLYAANADMERVALCDVDGDLLLVPELGRLRVTTELGVLQVAPGEFCVVPRGLRFSVSLPDGAARGWVAERFGGHFRLPERGPIGANGLLDERHVQVPVPAYRDDREPWTVVVRQGGRLWEVASPHTPFDVVAWHGRYVPFKASFDRFNALGSVSWDHPDPSIFTVLTSPIDASGRSALDLVVFRDRWDVSQHTFRPPYFHRNSAIEFNGIVRAAPGERWPSGSVLYTPLLAPHGVSGGTYERAVTAEAAAADAPERIADGSLWIQFESAFQLEVMPWMLDHPTRDRDHLASFAEFRPGPSVPGTGP